MAAHGAAVTWIADRKIRLFLLRRGETTPDGLRLDDGADACTFFEDGKLTVIVRAHCFRYRRRMLHLLIHEAIHCIEYVDGLVDIESPKDCTRAATALSSGLTCFLDSLPSEWKRAAGLLG